MEIAPEPLGTLGTGEEARLGEHDSITHDPRGLLRSGGYGPLPKVVGKHTAEIALLLADFGNLFEVDEVKTVLL